MTLDEVLAEIQEMRDEDKSYGYIGNKYGVNKGIIYRILHNGYEPKDKSIRRKLGLEDLTVDFVRQVRNPKGIFVKDDM